MDPSRPNLERSFSIPAEEAADFLTDDPSNPVQPQAVTDFHTPAGPRTRADTIRKRSDAHSPIQPLVGREDLTGRFSHPYVLEAIEAREQARNARDEEANVFEQAHRSTQLKQAEKEVQERREEIESILDRARNGGSLDAEQMALLLDRDDINPETEQIRSRVTGKTYRCDTPELLGNLNNGIGSSALWAGEDALELYRDLPVRLLRHTAMDLQKKPVEAAIGEHVESVGVEAVISEDPHFRTEEAEDSEEAGTKTGPVRQNDPRKNRRPTFATTA